MSIQMCTLRCMLFNRDESFRFEKYISPCVFKPYKKKKLEQLGKNPQNYTAERNESFVFEQKPIEFDIRNDEEEKRLRKELRKERKNNRRSLKKTRP